MLGALEYLQWLGTGMGAEHLVGLEHLPARTAAIHAAMKAMAHYEHALSGRLIEGLQAIDGVREIRDVGVRRCLCVDGTPQDTPRFESLLGDAQSQPQVGSAEVEKMNEAGVSAVLGAYASAICLATTQAAAKYNLPHVVDVGVADQIVERGLKNTFRFGPGYRKCAEVAVANLHVLNTAAGKPARRPTSMPYDRSAPPGMSRCRNSTSASAAPVKVKSGATPCCASAAQRAKLSMVSSTSSCVSACGLNGLIGAFTALSGVFTVALLTGIVASAFATRVRTHEIEFTTEVEEVLKDGHLDAQEQRTIEHLRREYSITEDHARAIVRQIIEEQSIDEHKKSS